MATDGVTDGGLELGLAAEHAVGDVEPLERAPIALDVVELGRVDRQPERVSQDDRSSSALVVSLLLWIGPLSSTSTTGTVERADRGAYRDCSSRRRRSVERLVLETSTISSPVRASRTPKSARRLAWPGAWTLRSKPLGAQVWAR